MSLSKIQLSELLVVYGELLTEKQRDVVSMYCDCDCTLSEIAAEHGISRQSVRDTILNAESSLAKFESALHIVEFSQEIKRCADEEIAQITKKFVGKE